MEDRLGMVHVYTGDGKGKTTAALGLALRAIGHGLRVYMVQFMKIGYTGEILNTMQNSLSLEIIPFNIPCEHQKQHDIDVKLGQFKGYCKACFDVKPMDAEKAKEAFEAARKAAVSGRYDIVILDEANVAMHKELIPVSDVLKLLDEKAQHTEIVLTGRNAPQEIIARADYVSEVQRIKHPYDLGIFAREGIEF
ncbi:MAG: cob(I)yrinic acid a,c-diamide adenosyltransferase [Candidatus Diapherotrites archaeon]